MRQLLPITLFLLVGEGCAHETAEERQIRSLQDEVNKIEAQNTRMSDRVTSLEVQQAEERDKKKAPSASVAPPLRVVHLGDAEANEGKPDGDTEDLNPRPTIKIQGSSPRAKGGGQQIIEQTMPDENQPAAVTSGPRPAALDPEARKSYDAALALVNGKQYDKALEAFAAFLVRWPDHPYADNATYWRGECYFAKGEYARALEQFDGLVARFPLGNKAPDALLKAGISEQKLGNPQKATVYFDKLRRDFPNSDAAKRVPGSQPAPSGHQVSP